MATRSSHALCMPAIIIVEPNTIIIGSTPGSGFNLRWTSIDLIDGASLSRPGSRQGTNIGIIALPA